MADPTGKRELFAVQRALLTEALANEGRYFLRDDDPDRAEKRAAVVALCDMPKPLFLRAGFRSGGTDGGFYFRLTKGGEDVARVVGAP